MKKDRIRELEEALEAEQRSADALYSAVLHVEPFHVRCSARGECPVAPALQAHRSRRPA